MRRASWLWSRVVRLAAGAVCGVAAMAAPAAWGQAAPAKPPIRPADLEPAMIEAAIEQALTALYDSSVEPNYTFPPEHAFISKYYDQATRHMVGNQALLCWAMLAAGESYQHPPLFRRISWVLSSDTPYVYDRGMRATMLSKLPPARWGPWVRRDGLWLTAALQSAGQGANYGEEWAGAAVEGLGDNANGQYGVLGLWHLQQAGYPVPNEVWARIDAYWRAAQIPSPGDQATGWALFSAQRQAPAGEARFNTRVSGPMTAGGVATLSLTERFLASGRMDGGRFLLSPELRKGILWLDENFSLDDRDEAADRYYYFWTVQRVGGATGYRTFNGIDWFRDVTAGVLNEQLPSGLWEGDKTKGPLISTGFALLYLSKAYQPLAISKVRFDSVGRDGRSSPVAWNNRPHDLWNFTQHASDHYEVETTWQITELAQPVYGLIESPMLYLSTADAFTLGEQDVEKLRAYVEAGGLLVTNCEPAVGAPAFRSFQALGQQLFPGRELEGVPREHPFYGVHQKLGPTVQVQAISNGVRPLMVNFPADIGRSLQAGDIARGEGFVALSNLYLYVTGMNPQRTRLENHYTVQRVEKPAQPLAAARLRYEGDFDPEPNALPQLKAILANQHDTDLQLSVVAPAELSHQRVAFLTTLGQGNLGDEDAAAIRKWIEGGGTLWLDAAGGGAAAHRHALAMLQAIAPNQSVAPLSEEHPVLSGRGLNLGYDNRRVRYRFYALSRMGPVYTPRLQAVYLGDRPAIIYSTEDLTCGLAGLDHWGIFGYTPESARRLVVNGMVHAATSPPPPPARFDLSARAAPQEAPPPEAPALPEVPDADEAPDAAERPAAETEPAVPAEADEMP